MPRQGVGIVNTGVAKNNMTISCCEHMKKGSHAEMEPMPGAG
jgi:hypothetical protein